MRTKKLGETCFKEEPLTQSHFCWIGRLWLSLASRSEEQGFRWVDDFELESPRHVGSSHDPICPSVEITTGLDAIECVRLSFQNQTEACVTDELE